MSREASANLRASEGRGPWWWVPSLYFAEGVPYVVVMTVAVIMFKRLGVGNSQIALYTSWLYLPYAIKPLWSPLVQRIGTRRGWVVVMQLVVGAGLACTAFAIPMEGFLRWSLVALAAVAISSATHDVAADGFYLLALSSHQQAWFVGIRSTAYRMAMIAGQGLLVMLAGALESSTGLPVVDVKVQAVDAAPATVAFEPNKFSAITDDSAQRIVVQNDSYPLSFRGRPAADAKSLKNAVHQWNVEHGFYEEPEQSKPGDTKEKSSWIIALEEFIRDWFGPKNISAGPVSDRGGDVAVVMMRLTQQVPPGEQLVVQFGQVRGDKSFTAIEGERFVVTEANWSQPFASVVQVDSQLNRASEATFEIRSGNLPLAWSLTFYVVAASFLVFAIYHLIVMPRPAADALAAGGDESTSSGLAGFLVPFADFFRKPRIVAILAFLLLYRFPEAQLVKLTTPFLLDPREIGGLALTTGTVGFIYGTVGVIVLTLGGIIGGFVVARYGLGRCLWPMALAMHLPNLAFLYLAYALPVNKWLITSAVAVEQFGYGFGFTAYMLYCVYVATGKHETVHYALCTGCMALGMMIPGMWSGWLQELIGYQHFFVWIMIAMIPSLLAVALIPVDREFGKKAEETAAE
jgi:PAT family beta-lactamase induction signal transducer AmpG